MPSPTLLIRIVARAIAIVAVTVATVYFVRAFDSRRMPALSAEHRIVFAAEFTAADEETTDWDAYLAIEETLADELRQNVVDRGRVGSMLDRYSTASSTYPDGLDGNWNRSYELKSHSARGVAVLLHGLTDSPYSMLSTAQSLAGAGYNVVVPRMPGHGFAVGGLMQANQEDWMAAVRVAMRHAAKLARDDDQLILGGYSNGGLLAIEYALDCDPERGLRCPDRIVLLSPAIAVSPLAVVSSWHAAISWIPWFEKFRWLSILPEIDPFKFTSFPKHAASEFRKLAKHTHRRLQDPDLSAGLPPLLTFQSVVDNTVSSRAIVDTLYSRVPANGSEIVVYDVNRSNTVTSLMRNAPQDPSELLNAGTTYRYGITVVRNRSTLGPAIETVELVPGQRDPVRRRTDMAWPKDIYSLSHIAIPFSPDDPVYGEGSRSPAEAGNTLGSLAPKGESGVLLLSSDFFLRTRYNPFFAFQTRHLLRWLNRSAI